MRYQVPQFVDVEDKIIGPLTLKQFLTYFSAVLILIPVYLLSDLSLFLTLALPVFAVAAAFAHFRPGGKTLFSFLGNAAGFFTKSRVWTWQRTPKRKFLPVRGAEFDVPFSMGGGEAGGLTAKAQQIETEGNVSTEDVEDPLTAEQETPPNLPLSGEEKS